MALTFTQRTLGKDSETKASPGALFCTVTSVTLDNTYAAGGIALTPAQLGLTQAVYFGVVNIRTSVATASPSDGALDCANPGAPKLKLQAAGSLAELANGAGSGAVVDVLAFGY